ncbi:MAG: hypothetical protein JSS53_04565 [Proteobacteria bacterium]|nr:hypothetical protein [Pseudomonadota bacterium]
MDIKNITFFNFGKIKSEKQAKTIMEHTGIAFYVLGTLIFLIQIFTKNFFAIPGALIFLIIGYMLHQSHSRTGAIIGIIQQLLALSIYVFLATQNQLVGWDVWKDAILSLVIFVYAIRACQAAFLYHHLIHSKVNTKNLITKTLLAIIYSVIYAVIVYFIFIKLVPENLQALSQLAISVVALLGLFLSFNGWLPFTKNKSVCVN